MLDSDSRVCLLPTLPEVVSGTCLTVVLVECSTKLLDSRARHYSGISSTSPSQSIEPTELNALSIPGGKFMLASVVWVIRS